MIPSRSATPVFAIDRRTPGVRKLNNIEHNHKFDESIAFALIGATLLVCEARGRVSALALTVTADCVQLRLLCNVLDGLIAVEGGGQTKTGRRFW